MTAPAEPVLVDTYSTREGHPGRAHVLSATMDPKTGRRNEYLLTYAWQPPSGTRTGRFQVLGCTCRGFFSKRACRHAIDLFDVLNVRVVAAFLLSAKVAVVTEAYAKGRCMRCGGARLSIRLVVQGAGGLRIQACPACRQSVVK